jgi:hypothetical protein
MAGLTKLMDYFSNHPIITICMTLGGAASLPGT